MSEQPSAPTFPRWLIAVDLIAAILVVAGLFLHNEPDRMASMGLPVGTDLLLLGLGALGVVGCGSQFARIALTAARSRSNR
ncbi:hypothetical protein [Cognatilysobacter lacus]|uniref:Uncharacterized protein n=1 Tax=Cognatilysobacter lacus TaxID=1643323 RepID=A0A5D8Z7F5_9GAMM|nr:hypothetical protein [Lysobacter lacus]TZF90818.1 hypothetical protein FW784_03720 [Lysobacter lacus]